MQHRILLAFFENFSDHAFWNDQLIADTFFAEDVKVCLGVCTSYLVLLQNWKVLTRINRETVEVKMFISPL